MSKALKNYECEGQMNIYDWLKATQPKECNFSGHTCNKKELWKVAHTLDDIECPETCCRNCKVKMCGARCNGSEEPKPFMNPPEEQKEDKKEKEEKEKIVRALEKNKGDLINAAKSINMPYKTFYHNVNKYGLSDKVVKRRGSYQKLHKLERIDKYCKLRRQGVGMVEAAQQVGVCMNTSIKYELIFKNEY